MPAPIPTNPFSSDSYEVPRGLTQCMMNDCNMPVRESQLLCDWHADPRPDAK